MSSHSSDKDVFSLRNQLFYEQNNKHSFILVLPLISLTYTPVPEGSLFDEYNCLHNPHRLKKQEFFKYCSSLGGHLFWPPSMVYISVIILHKLKITIFHCWTSVGSFYVLHLHLSLTCGFSSCLYFCLNVSSESHIFEPLLYFSDTSRQR